MVEFYTQFVANKSSLVIPVKSPTDQMEPMEANGSSKSPQIYFEEQGLH